MIQAGGEEEAGQRVSVVICAYTDERWADLVDAVNSVVVQGYPPYETIIVIDHCPMLFERATITFPHAVVTTNPGPQGLADARNQGIRLATGDIVAFMDDDARAEPDWLERLVSPYQDDGVAGVGGYVQPDWLEGRPGWFPSEFNWVVGCSYRGLPSSAARVRNFIGANMSFRRSTLDDLGGFTAALGRTGANTAGCEETELCIRAGRLMPPGALIYEPRSGVVHRVPAPRATWSYFVKRCYGEGKSKALVASFTGTSMALESERTYLRRTIPAGVGRSLRSALAGDLSGLFRAVALATGVVATMAGYSTTTVRSPRRSHHGLDPASPDRSSTVSGASRTRVAPLVP
jgi:Glycosyl transferase family 2